MTMLTLAKALNAGLRRALEADPKVLLHLEAGADGEQLAVLRGIATLTPGGGPDWAQRIGDAY